MPEEPLDPDVVAALRGVRAVVGLVSGSLAGALEHVTLPQLRVLVLLRSTGSLPVGELAALLRISPSGGTRAAERMERDGWLERTRSPDDRRTVTVVLTEKGARLVDAVIRSRRDELESLLGRMDAAQRRAVVTGLSAFADSAREPLDDLTMLTLALGTED